MKVKITYTYLCIFKCKAFMQEKISITTSATVSWLNVYDKEKRAVLEILMISIAHALN